MGNEQNIDVCEIKYIINEIPHATKKHFKY